VRAVDALRLVALAAIWGAAFIFIRVAAPELGGLWTSEGRLLIGAGALFVWFLLTGVDIRWRRYLRFYAAMGVVGTAIPFTLFSFAGTALPGSTMAILNTTAPMFALLVGAGLGWERLTTARAIGVVLGAFGVWLVTHRPYESAGGAQPAWALAACLFASLLFAVTSLAVRRWAKGVPATGMALGAQVTAALVLAPFLPLGQPAAAPSAIAIANLVALGVLASGVAYVLYFRLIADVGATRTQTVSLLVPAFGLLWGYLFLGESIGWTALSGAACIVLGTLLIVRR